MFIEIIKFLLGIGCLVFIITFSFFDIKEISREIICGSNTIGKKASTVFLIFNIIVFVLLLFFILFVLFNFYYYLFNK